MLFSDPNIKIFITSVTFCSLFFFCFGIVQYMRQREKRREMLEKIGRSGESSIFQYEEGTRKISDSNLFTPMLDFFKLLGDRISFDPTHESRIKIKFLRAGIRRKNAGTIFWGAKGFFCICLPALFLISRLTVLKVLNNNIAMGLSVLIALVGFYLPDIWLTIKSNIRREKLIQGLPDALDLLVVCVEAGMGLDGAIHRVAEETKLTNPVLSDELKLLNLELRAGKSRQDALRNLALRTNIGAMNSLVTLLIQTDKFGTSVAKALQVFSDSFRTQRYQKAEEFAAKMPVKLIFPLILFIFPSLFVVILGPAAIQIYENIIKGLN
jgi:tight adherence protein C